MYTQTQFKIKTWMIIFKKYFILEIISHGNTQMKVLKPMSRLGVVAILRRQRQVDLSEFKASLLYKMRFRIGRVTQWDPVQYKDHHK